MLPEYMVALPWWVGVRPLVTQSCDGAGEISMRRFALHERWTALGLAACALVVFGCANCRFPQIDPSGERLFVDGPAGPEADFRSMPDPNKAPTRVGLSLCPRASVAPIGSEVVLIAGVKGPDEYLRTNERIEWMLDPASVGQFIDLDRGSWTPGRSTTPTRSTARRAGCCD